MVEEQERVVRRGALPRRFGEKAVDPADLVRVVRQTLDSDWGARARPTRDTQALTARRPERSESRACSCRDISVIVALARVAGYDLCPS